MKLSTVKERAGIAARIVGVGPGDKLKPNVLECVRLYACLDMLRMPIDGKAPTNYQIAYVMGYSESYAHVVGRAVRVTAERLNDPEFAAHYNYLKVWYRIAAERSADFPAPLTVPELVNRRINVACTALGVEREWIFHPIESRWTKKQTYTRMGETTIHRAMVYTLVRLPVCAVVVPTCVLGEVLKINHSTVITACNRLKTLRKQNPRSPMFARFAEKVESYRCIASGYGF